MDLSKYIDHTLLKPTASKLETVQLCREAVAYGFASVCVLPVHIAAAAEYLNGTNIPAGTVIGFPLGSLPSAAKQTEAEAALVAGARELDMVINLAALAQGDYEIAARDIRNIVNCAMPYNAIVKVIIETSYLRESQKIEACRIVSGAGADYIKTSTGFGPGGATIEDVKLFRANSDSSLRIKAAGGIRTHEFAAALVNAGADRLGTSSGIVVRGEDVE